MRNLLVVAVILCAVVPALAAPTAPVNPMDWVGPAVPTMISNSAISDDGTVAAVYNQDGNVDILDTSQGRIIDRCSLSGYDTEARIIKPNPYGPSMHLSSHGEYLALNCHNGSVLLWNRLTAQPVKRIRCNTLISSVVFMPGTNRLYIATTGGTFSVYDCDTGKTVKEKPIGVAVFYLCVLPDIGKLAGFADDSCVLIDPADYTLSHLQTDPHSSHVSKYPQPNSFIGYDKEQRILSAYLPSGILARWKMPEMELVSQEPVKLDILCITSTGYIITIEGSSLCLRDSNLHIITRSPAVPLIFKVSASVNGRFVFAGVVNSVVLDTKKQSARLVTNYFIYSYGNSITSIPPHDSIHSSLRRYYQQLIPGLFSFDEYHAIYAAAGKYTVFPAENGQFILRDITTGKRIGIYPNNEFEDNEGQQDRNLSLSNDAELIAGTRNNRFILRELKSIRLLPVPDINSAVSNGKLSPDGRLIAMAGFDFPSPPIDEYGRGSSIFIAKTGSTQVDHKLFPHQGYVLALQFNTKGSRLFSIDEANTLRMWDTTSGKLLFTLPNAGNDAYYCMDDKRILVRANPVTYDLYDAEKGTYIARTWRFFNFENRSADYATVSADGRYDGSDHLINKQIWTFDHEHSGILSKTGLVYTPGLWGTLSQ